MTLLRRVKFVLPLLFLFLAACQKQERTNVKYEMGERIAIGPFTYVVVENSWRNQLGEGFQVRSPQNRYLELSLSITNGGASEVSVPMLSIEASDGKLYQELSDGSGITNWLGVIRTIGPAQTIQGRILFDVPLSTFRLRLPDGGESGYEKYAWVEIPLRIDADQVQVPLPGGSQQ